MTEIVRFGRIYKEDLATGASAVSVRLADGSTQSMNPLLSATGILQQAYGGMGAGTIPGAAYLSPTSTATQNVAGWTAMLADIASGGGVLLLERGEYLFNATLSWPTGLLVQGVGLGYASTVGSAFNFSAMSGSDPIITIANVNGGGIKGLSITGRSAGATGDAILFTGTNRQMVFEDLIVSKDYTTDGACLAWDHSAGGYSTMFQLRNVRTGEAAYGFRVVGATGNFVSATLLGCYANGHTIDGFNGRFDQCGFHTCYAEGNTAYGWNLVGGINANLYGCSAETNGKSAVKFDNYYGGGVYGLLGAGNGSAGYPSMIETANGCLNLTVCGVDEASAGTGATQSSAHTAGVAPTMSFANNRFQLPLDSTLDAMPRIQSGGIYIGGRIHYYGSEAPTTGTWIDGDFTWNTGHAANNIPGWIYTGTEWRRFPYTLGANDPYFSFETAMPTSGDYPKGWVVFNISGGVGDPIGWKCTVASVGGNGGTWGTMPNLA